MKRLAAACAIVALWAGGSPARANDSTDPNKHPGGRRASLAREYRELRLKRRHLPPGIRLSELDDAGGRLERTLSDLGAELGHPPHTKRTVIRWLGQPDAILGKPEMNKYLGVYYRGRESARQVDLRRDRRYLIYFWRGWHDFLFFISEKGVIVDHGWWFAYE